MELSSHLFSDISVKMSQPEKNCFQSRLTQLFSDLPVAFPLIIRHYLFVETLQNVTHPTFNESDQMLDFTNFFVVNAI